MTKPERQEKYDGKTIFLPNVNAIIPGDILLTFNAESEDQKGLKQSKMIRSATGGRFSHALICSSPPTFIEAIGTGVSTLSLARCFAHSIENVRVVRYPDHDIAQNAASYVQREVGRDYSVARAVNSVFPQKVLDRIEDRGTFCSALVAQAYVNAGSPIFQKTPVERTTPATIENLTELQDITASVFREGFAPGNIEILSALDGDRAPTPSAKQTELSSRCAKALFPVAEAISKQFPELSIDIMPTMFGLMQFLLSAYAQHERVPAERRDDLIDGLSILDDQLATFINSGEFEAILHEMATIESQALEEHIAQSFEPTPDIDVDHIRNLYQARIQQIAARQESMDSYAKVRQFSPTFDAYLPIEEAAIEELERSIVVFQEVLDRVGG